MTIKLGALKAMRAATDRPSLTPGGSLLLRLTAENAARVVATDSAVDVLIAAQVGGDYKEQDAANQLLFELVGSKVLP